MGSIAKPVLVLCRPVQSAWNDGIVPSIDDISNCSILRTPKSTSSIGGGIILNPFAECFVPTCSGELNSLAPVINLDEKKHDLSRLNPKAEVFYPPRTNKSSMHLESSNLCRSSYSCFLGSNYCHDSRPDCSNSALFLPSLSDKNDKDCSGRKGNFCNISANFSAERSADPRPQDIYLPTLNPLASQFIPQAPRPSSSQNSETEDPLDITPSIFDLDTPDLSLVECPENNNRAEL